MASNVRALKIDCTGAAPVVVSDVTSPAENPLYGGSYARNPWGLALPGINRYLVLGQSGNNDEQRLDIFDTDGALVAQPIVYTDYSGTPVGLYANPDDPTEVTVILWGNNQECVISVVTGIDGLTPEVTTRNLSPESSQNWAHGGTNPYYASPGYVVQMPTTEGEDDSAYVQVRDYPSDTTTALGTEGRYVNGSGGAKSMGDRLVYGIDGAPWVEFGEETYYQNTDLLRVLDYKTPGSPQIAELDLPVALAQALDGGTSHRGFPTSEGFGGGSYTLDTDNESGIILVAGNFITETDINGVDRHSTMVWKVQGPGRGEISLPEPGPIWDEEEVLLDVTRETWADWAQEYTPVWKTTLTEHTADANHTVVGASPALSSRDTTTSYLHQHAPLGGQEQMMGVLLAAWEPPEGKTLKRFKVVAQARRYSPYDGVSVRTGSLRISDFQRVNEDQPSITNGFANPSPGTWGVIDNAIISPNAWVMDRLSTGDLFVGTYLSGYATEEDEYDFDLSQLQVYAIITGPPE